MHEFLLILHDRTDGPMRDVGPEDMQAVVERYMNWAGEMASRGKLRSGQKLEDGTVRHLSGRPGHVTVVDGPFPETKEVVGGYFLLTADSYDEAVALASTCPHLDFGRIEVRRIEPTM